MKVLFEQVAKENNQLIEGLTKNHLRVIAKGSNDVIGEVINVKINKVTNEYLEGEILL
jgi:threonylcarbamoyladenosine tRNA methylthiotransferase MtaB